MAAIARRAALNPGTQTQCTCPLGAATGTFVGVGVGSALAGHRGGAAGRSSSDCSSAAAVPTTSRGVPGGSGRSCSSSPSRSPSSRALAGRSAGLFSRALLDERAQARGGRARAGAAAGR
jgi:hypothetical protein